MSRFGIVGTIALTLFATLGTASAQELDFANSNEILPTLGYQEAAVNASPDGVSAPETLEAGYTLVTLNGDEANSAYLNIVQYPEGLDEATAIEQALLAGASDVPQEGWTYFGGTNTPGLGESATFLINLEPGEYHWAVSYYEPYVDGEGEEFMHLLPLTVTDGDGDATPVTQAPEASITLEMTDELQNLVTPDPVPAGPQIWEITNTGTHHAHHVVIFGIPEEVTAQDVIGEFNAMMSGTPRAGEPLMAQFSGGGYAALQSGGQTTWVEYNFDPGTYAAICFIIDPDTGRPHVLDGMVTTFTVE